MMNNLRLHERSHDFNVINRNIVNCLNIENNRATITAFTFEEVTKSQFPAIYSWTSWIPFHY